jgi:thioredoxin 1
MVENLLTITDQNFQDIISGDQPVLVDFWAEWCGPCRLVAPHLEALATEHPDRLTVAKLNIDENPQSPASYGVMSIPTLILFKNGEEVRRIVGARPKEWLYKNIREHL